MPFRRHFPSDDRLAKPRTATRQGNSVIGWKYRPVAPPAKPRGIRFVVSDDPQLQFVLIEIELGITFVQTALNAYFNGHDEHGDSAKANAIKAMESANHFMSYLDTHGQRVARAEPPRLAEAIKALA
jgi:hypothetical protein